MNKKNLIRVAVLGIVILLLGFWWITRQSNMPFKQQVVPFSPSGNVATKNSPNPTPAAGVPSSHQAETEHEKKVWDLLLATPIAFYGKVVDDEGNPVAGAGVSISMSDTPWEGHTKLQKTSDDRGLFSVSGHGLGLVVNVTKDGYYTTDQSGGNFGYSASAGPTNTHQSPSNPAVFVLKKRGQSEHLIVTHSDVDIAGDGSPRQMSLATEKTRTVPNGDIIVQAWVQDQGIPVNSNKPYNWRCKITVPGGGLQPRTGGKFNFTAPENGYQASDEIDMQATAAQWNPSASRSYFLKLGNGNYARMDFTVAASKPYGFVLTSYLNPKPGSRNLEFDPKQQVKSP